MGGWSGNKKYIQNSITKGSVDSLTVAYLKKPLEGPGKQKKGRTVCIFKTFLLETVLSPQRELIDYS